MISVSVRTHRRAQRDGLRDEPAHRRPDQMNLAQPQAIDEPDHIAGHVADRVRRRPAPHHDVGQARRREVPQVGRPAHVPVVEPDDEKTAPGQTCAQLIRPGDHLRRPAHDQYHRRRARVPERLIRQLDVIRGNPARRASSDITHERSLACNKHAGHIRRSPAGLPAAPRPMNGGHGTASKPGRGDVHPMMAAFLARGVNGPQSTVRYRAIPYLTVMWPVEVGLGTRTTRSARPN